MSVEPPQTPDEPTAPPQAKSHAPPTIAIRPPTPRPQRLSRKTLMAGALALGAIIAFALVNGFSDHHRPVSGDGEPQQTLQTPTPPQNVREAPSTYDASQLQPPIEEGHDFLWGDHHRPGNPEGGETERAPTQTHTTSLASSPDPLQAEADAARVSPILFGRSVGAIAHASGSAANAGGPHSGFMNHEANGDDGVLDAAYAPPRSPYILQSGAVIPAALLTALNSDQPGRVVAQVSENVFDSVTGHTLLIPQGARLIGAYDADTSYGEQRLLVVWNRLIMPNGWSMALHAMPATDATGASGLNGHVDAHLGRIALASLLSGALGIAANSSKDDDSDGFAQSVGDAAAQEAAQTGSRLVDRELAIRPTIRIGAGARLSVLVSQDLILRPYQP